MYFGVLWKITLHLSEKYNYDFKLFGYEVENGTFVTLDKVWECDSYVRVW